jgi:hypothetical protein
MDVHEEIKLSLDESDKKPKLPNWIKPIQIGERLFLFRWTFTGWKQLSREEELDIKLRYGT